MKINKEKCYQLEPYFDKKILFYHSGKCQDTCTYKEEINNTDVSFCTLFETSLLKPNFDGLYDRCNECKEVFTDE